MPGMPHALAQPVLTCNCLSPCLCYAVSLVDSRVRLPLQQQAQPTHPLLVCQPAVHAPPCCAAEPVTPSPAPGASQDADTTMVTSVRRMVSGELHLGSPQWLYSSQAWYPCLPLVQPCIASVAWLGRQHWHAAPLHLHRSLLPPPTALALDLGPNSINCLPPPSCLQMTISRTPNLLAKGVLTVTLKKCTNLEAS